MNGDSRPAATPTLLPSGAVTFAFTDIQGSTHRWERHRAAMETAVRRHDALVREAIAAHGGHIFKAAGDGFCAAFERPQDAIAAVLAAQRALVAEDFSAVDGLRVRAAIHTGTADERDGDYFGPTLNRVARLLAIAHGGQVLVSGSSADLARGALPAKATLRDLGEHRLKDLARPEHVFQLIAPGIPTEFEPLRSLDAHPNNLPDALTSFIGRETETAEIAALVAKHRLVTLVGSGGVGKTRTSLQVAANVLDGFGNGVWFVELAPLQSGDYVATTVAQVVGVTLPPDGDPLAHLVQALRAQSALLVFDNCEHLIDAAARVVSAILHGCPRVKILASSRQGLGIAGEATYRMPSLGMPNAARDGDFRALDATSYEATALFVERARATDQRFAPNDTNAATILEICRRLDGIPLAIELAAARVKVLSPRQVREHLDERFHLLTGGGRDVLPRHQTLRALIDWSHDLLDEREQALFRRLAIFVNGFTLEGAAAVGSGDDLAEIDAFDLLASLVDKSLVLAEPSGETLRYRLLESTRAYAREKLETAGDGERSAERHVRFLSDRYAALEERFETTGRRSELDAAFATELDDVRAALDFALHGGRAPAGAALLVATGATAWREVGLEHEYLARAEHILAQLSHDEPLLRARVWTEIAATSGNLLRKARGFEAATQAVACARSSGDARVLSAALRQYAEAAIRLSRFRDAETALGEAEALPDRHTAGRLRLLETRSRLSALQGNPECAVRDFEHLVDEYRSLGHASGVRHATLNLAEWTHAAGETRRAIELLRDVLPACRTAGDRNMLVMAMVNLGGYLAAVDHLSEATDIAREAIRELAPREPATAFIAIALEPLALALALRGDVTRAVALEGYADAALRAQGFEREFTETTTNHRLMALLAERLDPSELARRLGDGAALQPEAAIALALAEP